MAATIEYAWTTGAGESVCPIGAFPSYARRETEKTGLKYRARGGQRLTNVGENRPRFKTNGRVFVLKFQETTDVKKSLAAAFRTTAKGNRIVLDDEGSGSYIENEAIGTRATLKILNGAYMMEMAIQRAPFQMQAK